MKIRECFKQAVKLLTEAGIASARLDSEVLLQVALQCSKAELYLKLNEEMPRTDEFFSLVEARQAHQPIAYITGEKEFMGLSFQVDKRVLIPRPETELLAEAVIAECKEAKQLIRILDLGTGSGALAVSLAKFLPQVRVTATDISPAALEVAKSNARRLDVLDRIDFRQGDLWLALAEAEEPFNVIVSNPPYISEREMAGLDRDVLDYEPHLALEAKENGLEFYRLISERLEEFLIPGGLIAFEAGWKQASEVAWLLILTDLIEKTEIRKDYAGIERVVLGWRKNEKQQINS